MGQLLTTDTVAPRDRLAYWTDAICDVYVQLECDALRRDAPFHEQPGHEHAGIVWHRCLDGHLPRLRVHHRGDAGDAPLQLAVRPVHRVGDRRADAHVTEGHRGDGGFHAQAARIDHSKQRGTGRHDVPGAH